VAIQGCMLESFLKPRFLEIVGRAYGRLGRKTMNRKDIQEFSGLALENLVVACNLDPLDVSLWFQLALHQALARDLSKAFHSVRKSLSLHAKHLGSLHLLALLYTAEKNFTKALMVIDIALKHYPRDLK
jgi:tetratricopeptide repeat protein 7